MKEVYEKLLLKFKKSNQAAKLKLAKDFNFSTAEEFLKFLHSKLDTKGVDPASTPKKPAKKKGRPRKEVTETTVALEKPIVTVEEPINDMVIAFDTTGSMGSYLDAVRRHVTTLIPDLFKNMPNLRLKIVAFGDYCDMRRNGSFGNAYQETSLTNDQKLLTDFVHNAQSTGGGDPDEFYELVIQKITNETPWREGSKRSVLFIADADPHPIGYSYGGVVTNNQIDWRVEAYRAADKGIQFDTLQINVNTHWYAELSQITGGINAPFRSSGKTQEIIKAAAYARGGEKSKAAFMATLDSVEKSGDKELTGMYKSFSSLL